MNKVAQNRSKRFHNVNYKADADYALKVARTLLSPVGIWPLDKAISTFEKAKTFLQISIIFVMMCFLLIPHVIYTFYDCEDLRRYMKVIAAQVFSLLAIVKFWTIVLNKAEIACSLEQMKLQYKYVKCKEDREVMTKSAKVGRLFTLIYLGLSYGGALPYHILMPLLADKVVKEDNTTQIPLPYLSDYVFFVVENSPFYEILFVSQMTMSIIILSTNCGVYSLIATCAMHSCGLFQVVSRQINAILEKDQSNFYRSFGNVIQHHIQAIRYSETIERSLNIVFLSEMIGCTVIVCFLEYGVLKEWEDKKPLGTVIYFILMTSIFTNIFIISFIGDRLKEESERIGQSIYFLEWYGLPREIANDVILVIIRSSRPSVLTAGKIFDVSLQGFCDICKTSAAYFNFIRTMAA